MNIENDFHLSAASERNKIPILMRLKKYFLLNEIILEIGSGTGQHARFFAEQLPFIKWLPTDLNERILTLSAYLKDAHAPNIYPAITLNVSDDIWPNDTQACSTVYTANTFHIMPLSAVKDFWKNITQTQCYKVIAYGPFTYKGQYTSKSNEEFHEYLRSNNPKQGIRAFEEINNMAEAAGFKLLRDHKMPANNQLIVWYKP